MKTSIKTLNCLAILTLMIAVYYGWSNQNNNTLEYLTSHFKGYVVEKTGSEPESFLVRGGEKNNFLIFPSQSTGWGGPMTIAPVVNKDGVIEDVLIVEHRETRTFFDYVISNNFLDQYNGKAPGAFLELGKDIDGITGATVTSNAISRGVRRSMDKVSTEVLGKTVPYKQKKLPMGRDEALLLVLYAAAMIASYFKIRKARLPVLLSSFVLLGLILKRPISISNIATLFMGHMPAIDENLLWWILVPGTLALIGITGKNIYCSRLCPFGAIQEIISKTGGLQITVPKKIQTGLKTAAKMLAWAALMVAFTKGNASNAAIEPFSTLFGLKGTPLQWYLVSMAIGGSFFIPRFWCRFFCPAGVCLNSLSDTRRMGKRVISGIIGSKKGGSRL